MVQSPLSNAGKQYMCDDNFSTSFSILLQQLGDRYGPIFIVKCW